MEHIEHLPQEIRSVVRGFCSHPIADVLRPHVVDYKLYSDTLPTPQTYPDANTFYIYFFTNKTLVNVIATLKQIEDFVGADVRVSEWMLRPKLWPLYEQAFPNYLEEQPDTPYTFHENDDWHHEVEDDIETN
jgi:hypothetical protein